MKDKTYVEKEAAGSGNSAYGQTREFATPCVRYLTWLKGTVPYDFDFDGWCQEVL